MLTMKLKLDIDQNTKQRIVQYQQQYSNLLHVYYNQVKEGNSKYQDLKLLQLNHVQLLDSHFKNSCMQQARGIFKVNEKNIFGGKQNFFNRLKGKITKEQYRQRRLSPIYSIGQTGGLYKGNRKFQLMDEETVLFKPSKKQHIELKFKCSNRSYKRYLEILIQHQQLKDLPITYKLTKDYIIITFDQLVLREEYKQYKKIENRIIAIDMNPNYIGWSILDWKNSEQFNIIDKGVLSLKNLNDYDNKIKAASFTKEKKFSKNKRNYELLQCSKFLIQKIIHYKCSLFAIEDLSINSKDHQKGKWFNKLVNNNWCRIKFINNLTKWCSIYDVQLIRIKPEFSSFIGNIVYRSLQLPDMILASIQISRRGYEFYHQYIKKDKDKVKNVVHPTISNNVLSLITQSLEELGVKDIIWKNLFELYYKIKKSKCKYRFPLQIKESFRSSVLKFENIVI